MKAILKPVKTMTEGKKDHWLEDRNGAKYKVVEGKQRQKFFDAITRNVYVEVTVVNGEITYASKKITPSAFKQFKNFPELEALRYEGPDPNNTVVKPNATRDFLKDCAKLKPKELVLSDLKWKTLLHDVVEAKNIMMVGPSGTGKTFTVQCIAKAFAEKRPYFYFNLGASQDPRTFLIGNTQFSQEKGGTFFNRSTFIEAITTENSVILLDELSRAHPDAWNILMTVLDEGQRFVRIDEADNTPTIKVAKGVCFLATANIGNEYTATRVLDHALTERFEMLEMEPLDKDGEVFVLSQQYPDVDPDTINSIAEIADATRKAVKDPNVDDLDKILSTRSTKAIAQMINNGFTLAEAAEVRIYPYYDNEGGADSQRTYMKQLVQRFIKVENAKEDTDEVFNTDDDSLLDEKPW